MTLAIHPHHCNLTLHCVKGSFINSEFKQAGFGGRFKLNKWLYRSAINEGEMKFKFIVANDGLDLVRHRTVWEGNSVYMAAKDLHTVIVPKGEVAAWLVYEGEEDPNYKPYCWSNADLNNLDTTGMYQRPTKEDIFRLLKQSALYE
jgi:hypothetical protein